MFLVTGALRQEMSDFKKKLEVESELNLSPCRFYESRLFDREVGLFLTSVSPKLALLERALTLLVDSLPIEGAILSGCAGGLVPGLQVGQLVLSQSVVYEAGHGAVEIEADAALHRRLMAIVKQIKCPFVEGKALTIPFVASTPSQKEQLGREHGAVAVDMENFHIAKFLSKKGIPFAVVRSIYDPLEDELPTSVSRLIDQEGNLKMSEGIRMMLSSPGDIFKLPDFARRAQKVRHALTPVLIEFFKLDEESK